jgi:hypothetical protein
VTEAVRVWRYHLARCTGEDGYERDSWSIVFIDEAGFVAICSDYGNWAYCWPPRHTAEGDTRKFLLSCDYDYIARKLGSSAENEEYDHDATVKSLKTEIAKYRREEPDSYPAYQARDDVTALDACSDEHEMIEWIYHCNINRVSDGMLYAGARKFRRNGRLDHWTRVAFPRLQAAIREDLAREAQP